jgi:hypothetical protein
MSSTESSSEDSQLNLENEEESDLKDSENVDSTTPPKNIRIHYIKKVHLVFKTIFVFSDQVYDIILLCTLLIGKEYWFAAFFLAVDLLPGLQIILT